MPVTRVQPINASEPLEIETSAGSTVASLKLGIEEKVGIRASAQRLVAGGRLLQDDLLVESLEHRIFLAQIGQPAAESPPYGSTSEVTEIKLLIRAIWNEGQEESTVFAKPHLPVSKFKEKAGAGAGTVLCCSFLVPLAICLTADTENLA